MKFGAHMSTAGGVWKALQRGASIQCEIVQIFVKSNMQWFGKTCSAEGLALYAKEFASKSFAAVFGHTGYLINLGAPPCANRDKSVQSLIHEIQHATALGLPQILAFHLNDSKSEFGARVDRHAHIGQGKIGRRAFRHIVNDPRFRDLPGCLETPRSEDLHEDVENLAVLRGLVKEKRNVCT